MMKLSILTSRVIFVRAAIYALTLVAAEARNVQEGNATVSLFNEYENNRPVPYREVMARRILARRPELKQAFEQRRSRDSTLARSNWRQLYFIFERSKYYEEQYNRYPVAGIGAGRIAPLIAPGSPLEN